MPVVPVVGLPALASSTDMETQLGRTFTEAELAAAEQLLDLASASIRDAVGQTLSEVADDAVRLRGSWAPVLVLPERPVTAVGSVSINGVALVADVDYWWPGMAHLVRGPRPTSTTHDIGRGDDWGGPEMGVDIVYSHGWETAPDDLRNFCITVAIRGMEDPINIKSETIGNYSVTFNESLAVGLSESEARRLKNRYGTTWQ